MTPTTLTPSQLAREMKAQKVANGWEARCPAHDDQQASLSIAEGRNGKLLLHCHAGCSFTEILAALQIPAKPKPNGNGHVHSHAAPSTMPTPTPPSKSYKTITDAIRDLSRWLGTHTGRWDYSDRDGYLVGVVLRFDSDNGKTIRPLRETPDGWVVGGMAEPRPIYHLVDLVESTNETVYVCEGEKACEVGTNLGLLTTTSPHGASSASKADWSSLAGRDVIILPDNDAAGLQYAEAVRDILSTLRPPAHVRTVNLPDLPPGGDLVEWMEMGRGVKEIEALLTVEQPSPDWQDGCNWVYSEHGRRLKTDAYNLSMVAAHDLRGALAWDEFLADVICVCEPPWHDAEYAHMGKTKTGKPWTDQDYTRLRLWLQRAYMLAWKKTDVYDVVPVVAQRQRSHPVRAYLDGLLWDGKPRLETWLISYLRSVDTEYTRQVGPKWLLSAVARVYKPGCKADNVLILEGSQGVGKSTALQILAGEWFADTPFHISSTDAFLSLRGSWIVELAELDSLMRAEDSQAKAFFSSATDKYRPPYARAVVEYPRQCVFAGSVNHTDYLRDATGGRRYWPVLCGDIDLDGLRRDRDQIWAEAVHRFRGGASWWLSRDQQSLATEEQEQRSTDDPWEDPIREWLTDSLAGGTLNEISVHRVLRDAVDMPSEKMSRPHETRVGRILTMMGWSRQRKRVDGVRHSVYRRPPKLE